MNLDAKLNNPELIEAPRGDIFLDISKEELKQLDKQGLIDIITKHYHQKRPTQLKIGKLLFSDDEYYSLEQTAYALDLKLDSLRAMTTSNKHLHKEWVKGNWRISGYEVIRYSLRPHHKRTRTQKESFKKFYINFLQAIKEISSEDLAIDSVVKFYDMLFPIKGLDRYKQVMALLGKSIDEEQTYKPIRQQKRIRKPSTKKPNDFSFRRLYYPSTTPQYSTGQSPNQDLNKDYVSISSVQLKVNADYVLIKDSSMPDEDAYRVRSVSVGVVRSESVGRLGRKKEDFKLNPSDLDRLSLAKSYIREIKVIKQFESKSFVYDRESVLKSLELAGTPAILYNGMLVFPPNTLDIVFSKTSYRKKWSSTNSLSH